MMSIRLVALLVTMAAATPPLMAAGDDGYPDYPLEIMNIKPIGTDGMEASNRIFRAYPGIRYNIRAAVIGGRYPYSFKLIEAPEGMTVNGRTGEIDWPKPARSAKAMLEVTDSLGKKASASWAVTVTKMKFLFVDAKNGRTVAAGGKGTLENPFKTIADFYPDDEQRGLRTSKYTDWAVYFRAGTYKIDGFKSGWGGINDKEWINLRDQHPNIFMAYPGEEATIDCESKHSLKVYPQPGFWIDGLRFRGMKNYGYALQIEAGGKHVTVRRCDFKGLGPTDGHHNQSFIRVTIGGRAMERFVVQDCAFDDLNHGTGIKLYAIHRALIEDNEFSNFRDTCCNGSNLDGAVAMKVCVRRCVFRGNVMRNFQGGRVISCLFSQPYRGKYFAKVTENEICHNVVRDCKGGRAISINGYKEPGALHVYRNTIEGSASVVHVLGGPFVFARNIFVTREEPVQIRSNKGGKVEVKDNLKVGRSELDDTMKPKKAELVGSYGHCIEPGAKPAAPATPAPDREEAVKEAPATDPKAARLYRSARDAERRGMRPVAETLYKRLVREFPESPLAAEAEKRL